MAFGCEGVNAEIFFGRMLLAPLIKKRLWWKLYTVHKTDLNNFVSDFGKSIPYIYVFLPLWIGDGLHLYHHINCYLRLKYNKMFAQQTAFTLKSCSVWIGSIVIILISLSKFLIYNYLSNEENEDSYRENNPVICFVPLILAALILLTKRPA